MLCPHCRQPVRTPVSRCNRCDWSPLDEQIQSLPLTSAQRLALVGSVVGLSGIAVVVAVAMILIGPASLWFQLLVGGAGLLLAFTVAKVTGGAVQQDLALGTVIRRPLPLVGHSRERTQNEDGYTYKVRFGDVISASFGERRGAALVPGAVYWITYSPHSQRIWQISPYDLAADAAPPSRAA